MHLRTQHQEGCAVDLQRIGAVVFDELHTAGEHKRTLTVFGENTEAGRAKFQEELEDTHALFKRFVAEHRPSLDLSRVATGEHWFGARALALLTVSDQLVTHESLTPQERKILALLADGLTNRQIGEELFLAEKTVKNYVSSILAKLGLERRTQAAVLAAKLLR